MLQAYINQVQALTRDSQGLFTPLATLTNYINEARSQTALQTGCIRRLISGNPAAGAPAQPALFIPGAAQPSAVTNSFQTIVGAERYPYQGFGNTYLTSQYQGVSAIIDVITIAVSWGGSWRPALDWMPWEEFQAWCRINQFLVTSYPAIFSIMNDGADGEVWLFPVPQAVCEMEWDCFCLPATIWSDSDYEALPHPFRRAVQYYAAAKVFEASGRMGQSMRMMQRFNENLGESRGAADRGKVPTRYPLSV